jgi:hypothetical protein
VFASSTTPASTDKGSANAAPRRVHGGPLIYSKLRLLSVIQLYKVIWSEQGHFYAFLYVSDNITEVWLFGVVSKR